MSDDKPAGAAVLEPKPSPAEIVKRAEAVPVKLEHGIAAPATLDEQLRVAKWAVESGLLPEGITTVAQAWMVMQRGAELGFPGLTAFEFLYPVNGKVRLTPDGAKAKALQSGLLADAQEVILGEGDAMMARVTILRRGLPTPVIAEFSVVDAKTAGLWGKIGRTGKPSAWVTYPKRMLKARARGFAYGDAFRDVIGGLQVRERFDLDPGEVVSLQPEGRKAAMPPSPPSSPDPLFAVLDGSPASGPAELHAQSETEIRLEPKEPCAHPKCPPSLVDKLPPNKTMVCLDCGEELRPASAEA